jgi:hypothetical protein
VLNICGGAATLPIGTSGTSLESKQAPIRREDQ